MLELVRQLPSAQKRAVLLALADAVLQRPKLASRIAQIGKTPAEIIDEYLALIEVIRAEPHQNNSPCPSTFFFPPRLCVFAPLRELPRSCSPAATSSA